MPLSMHQASVPVFVRMLGALSAILTKAEADAVARKIDPSVFVNARLAPDMFALARQVQIATDGVKGGVSRLAGVEIPSYPDTETSFEELQARIAKTVAYLESFTPDQIDGSEDRAVTMKLPGGELEFKGADYLLNFVLPNFYFHLTTAYAILRQNGVAVGKRDFLGGI